MCSPSKFVHFYGLLLLIVSILSSIFYKNSTIERLNNYFSIYFQIFSTCIVESLFLFVLAMESVHSIRFLYRHFISRLTDKSLNAFYYAWSHAKIDYSNFMNITESLTLKMILEFYKSEPVFLCIDDTTVSKFGQKFENVSKLLTTLHITIPII
jgi:hypothetical protein